MLDFLNIKRTRARNFLPENETFSFYSSVKPFSPSYVNIKMWLIFSIFQRTSCVCAKISTFFTFILGFIYQWIDNWMVLFIRDLHSWMSWKSWSILPIKFIWFGKNTSLRILCSTNMICIVLTKLLFNPNILSTGTEVCL